MNKSNSNIDQEQIEFLENAQRRIRQKKFYTIISLVFYLYLAFVLF